MAVAVTDGTAGIAGLDTAVVVGPMRTGTTLVARLLGSHPQAAYLGFELAEQWSAWTGLPFGAPGSDDVACPALGAKDATTERIAAARTGLDRLLREHVGATGRTPGLIVLKNPHFWHRVPFVLRVLPQARIVRTGRDLPATVASLRRLWERSLEQHGRAHHLPRDPDRCWDYVPAAHRHRYAPSRTFPGGRIEVLVEFVQRVERRLDRVERSHGDRFAATVRHGDLVEDFRATSAALQGRLGVPVAVLEPPQPLDPSRLDEWRELLTPAEQSVLAQACSPGERTRR